MDKINQQDNPNMMYLAINGDGVGGGIGEAIANDDHEALAQLSSKLNSAHQGFCKWAESNGGKIIVSSGDEAIVSIPANLVAQVENIRQQYENDAGHTLTIGVGQSMSEAAKALIYGKMNNKNQTVQYDPHIDDFISESISGDENHSVPLDEQNQDPQEGIVPSQIQGNIEGESLEQPNAQPAPMAPAAQPQEGMEQAPTEEQAPGIDNQDPNASKAPEGDPAVDQELAPEGKVSENPEGDVGAPNENDEEVPNMEQNTEKNPNMEQNPEDMEKNPENEDIEEQEDPNAQQLKADIKSALSVFRDNQQLLEQLKGASPEVYNASLAMLRSMIAMAKQLNFSPEGIEDSELEEQVESEDDQQDPSNKEGKDFPPKKDDKGKKEFPPKKDNKEESKEDVKKKPLKTE